MMTSLWDLVLAVICLTYLSDQVHSFLIPKEDFMVANNKRSVNYIPTRDTRATWLITRQLHNSPLNSQYAYKPRNFYNSKIRNTRTLSLGDDQPLHLLQLLEADDGGKQQVYKRSVESNGDNVHHLLDKRLCRKDGTAEGDASGAQTNHPSDIKTRASWNIMKKSDQTEDMNSRASWNIMKKSGGSEINSRASWNIMKKSDNKHDIENRVSWNIMKKSIDGPSVNSRASWNIMKRTNGKHNIDNRASWNIMKKSNRTPDPQSRASWHAMKKSSPMSERATFMPMKKDVHYPDSGKRMSERASWQLMKRTGSGLSSALKRASWSLMKRTEGKLQNRAMWVPSKKSQEDQVSNRAMWAPTKKSSGEEFHSRAMWVPSKKDKLSEHVISKRATILPMRDLSFNRKPQTLSRTQHFINGRSFNSPYFYSYKPFSSLTYYRPKSHQDLYYNPMREKQQFPTEKRRVWSELDEPPRQPTRPMQDEWDIQTRRATWLPTRQLADKMTSQVRYLKMPEDVDSDVYENIDPTSRDVKYSFPTDEEG